MRTHRLFVRGLTVCCAVGAMWLPLYAARGEAYEVAPTVPRDQPLAEILAERVIAKQHERYIGWPKITRAANGDLLVVFSGDRDWHVDPWGKVYLVRSTDDGATWGEPVMILDSPLDDRNTSINALADGSLLLMFDASLAFDNPNVERYAPYQDYAKSLTPEVREQWKGDWIMRSTDHGHTWGGRTRAPARTPHGPAVLDDGRLMLVRPTVYESRDHGRTWDAIARVQRDPATWKSRYAFLSEQHAAQAADGRIVALSRYADKSDVALRQMVSTDGGRTWTDPTPTAMDGYPAHLLCLDNGWLVAVYGRRTAPMGERACLSKDHGETWLTDQEIVLSNAAPQNAGHLGYPSSVQLRDGSILTVYYQVEKESDGEYPCLMATHWRVRE